MPILSPVTAEEHALLQKLPMPLASMLLRASSADAIGDLGNAYVMLFAAWERAIQIAGSLACGTRETVG
jgi:hypothetical protein